MKKTIWILNLFLILILMLTGCKKEVAESQSGEVFEQHSKQKQLGVIKEYKELQEASDVVLFDKTDNSAALVDRTTGEIEQYDLPENTYFVCADKKMLYYGFCDEANMNYQICTLDRSTKETTTVVEKVMEQRSLFAIDVMDSEIHVVWELFGTAAINYDYEEYAYVLQDDGTYSESRLNQRLYSEMKQKKYVLIQDRDGHIYTVDYCLREFGEIYAENLVDNKIGIFDAAGELKENIDYLQNFRWVEDISEDYFVYYNEKSQYVIYDRTDNTMQVIPEANAMLLTCDEGCIYYYVSEQLEYNVYKEIIYKYDIETEEITVLFDVMDLPGTREYYLTWTDEFQVADGKCYYIGTDGVDVAWYMFDPANDETAAIEDVEPLWHYSYADYGSVICASKSVTCPFCETEIYSVYTEQFILDDRFPNADQINAYLAENHKEDLLYAEEKEKEITEEEPWHLDEYFSKDTDSTYCQSVEQVGSHYLQVFYSGYWYGGGAAHGYPYREYYLFDLDTGKEIDFTDLYIGTEEEFKQIAAEYTVLDWKEGDAGYFAQTADEVYDGAYQCVSLDMDIRYEEDGIVIQYYPYVMGPYAAGFIEVKIPYEALKMKESLSKYYNL